MIGVTTIQSRVALNELTKNIYHSIQEGRSESSARPVLEDKESCDAVDTTLLLKLRLLRAVYFHPYIYR